MAAPPLDNQGEAALPPGAVGTKVNKKGQTVYIDGFGRTLSAKELSGKWTSAQPASPGSQYPALGVSPGPGYDTLDLAKSEQYTGLSYSPVGWPEEDIISLQLAMEEAGFFDGDYTLGVWDQKSARAYAKVLAGSDSRNQSPQAFLQQSVTDRQKVGKLLADQKKRPKLQIQLANKEDIKDAARQATRELFGGDLPDDVADQFAEMIRSQQAAYQTDIYNSDPEWNENAPTLLPEEPESVGSQAERLVRERFPDQVAKVQFQDTFKTMLSTFNGLGG